MAGETVYNGDGTFSNRVQVMGSKIKVVRKRQIYSTTIPNTSGVSQIQFFSSPKTIARLKYIAVSCPTIAGTPTGNQEIYVTVGIETAYVAERAASVSSAATGSCNLTAAQNTVASKDLVFDDTTPLVVTFFNASSLDQTGNRMVLILYEEEATI